MTGGRLTDAEKKDLYDRFGKPPKRDEPLGVEQDNQVLFCAIGGGLYDCHRGRVIDTDVSSEEAQRKAASGSLEPAESYVKVRYGPSMHESQWVPPEYVLVIERDEAKFVSGEGYIPPEGEPVER